jgi:hypothetical protein
VALAHPARDQLRVLGAEVDDQNRVGVRYVGVNGLLLGVGLRHDTTLRTPARPGFSEPQAN